MSSRKNATAARRCDENRGMKSIDIEMMNPLLLFELANIDKSLIILGNRNM